MSNERSPFPVSRSSPRRRPGSTATSESRSESRLSSSTPLHSHTSWEESQQSVELFGETTTDDRNTRPSSRRDDRKIFDATTPTLIDEEDYPDDYYCKPDNVRSTATLGHEPDDGHRRTPGASMYRSVLEEQLRRTPGAESAQQTSAFSDSRQTPNMEPGLGFGLTLSTPLAAHPEQQTRTLANSTWETLGSTKASQFSSPDREPPLQSFASQLTSKSRAPRNHSPDRRHGAFSPALLRLTEDIGNLLNDDEDDEYTVEIPIFRTDNSEPMVAGLHDEWAGAFAVDNSTLAKQTNAEGDILIRTKARRQVGDAYVARTQQQQLRHRNTQQPIPRRGSNEVFEFGALRNTDERRAPQLLNFGGAFAPPTKESVPFSRPFEFVQAMTHAVAPGGTTSVQHRPQMAAATSATHQVHQQHSFMPNAQVEQPQSFDAVIDPSAPSQSFDTFSTTTRETPIDVYFRPNHLSSPSPIPSPAQPFPQSDMVATAQEYVPMSAQRLTPQYPQRMWSRPSPMPSVPAPAQYDHSLHQPHSWHPSPPGFGSVYSSSFGDTRMTMTPSPHMPFFQERESSLHPMVMQPMPDRYVAPVSTQQHRDVSYEHRGSPAKKDSKRGKRGNKKKDRKDKDVVVKQPADKSKLTSTSLGTSTTETRAEDEGEEGVSTCDDPADSKRAELDESPAVRLAFKNFYKAYRAEEQKGVSQAEEFAREALLDDSLPSSIHWRVYVELADLARRTNRFTEARRHYQKVCSLQPYASQGWVEYSKLEEECGNMNRVTNIMYAGLEYCEYNESLLIRAIKHQEKMGKHSNVRALLARLKHIGIDKVWRTVLEGALFEARVGNIIIARRALKYVMHYVPWYGPLYVEFYRLERDHGHLLDALDVVECGLSQIPRYSPLWFCAMRVCEELDHANLDFGLPRTNAMLQRANEHVSKEVIWKVYLEAAFLFERAAVENSERRSLPLDSFLSRARHYFALTIQTCRLNLRWKVWLAAARMELSAGIASNATRLFARAHEVAPEKVRSLTLLDYARLHEYIGERDVARAILCKGRIEYGHDWKVWLESVLLEMRGINTTHAFQLAASALSLHQGTGRLWSVLVQLSQRVGGVETQYIAFRKALNAVPKSGEVWCEGARIHFNPFSDVFDVDRARRHLRFAGRFTPQYGDSFLESVRVEIFRQWLVPIAEYIWDRTRSSFVASDDQEPKDCLTKYITDVSLALSYAHQLPGWTGVNVPAIAHSVIIEPVREHLSVPLAHDTLDLSAIILACSNADPNYGPLWFYCRRVHSDPPRKVIEHAATTMLAEMRTFAYIYLAAQVRRYAILSTRSDEGRRQQRVGDDSLELLDSVSMEHEEITDLLLRSYPSLLEIYNPLDPMTGLALMESAIDGCDFATGLREFNKNLPLEQMSSSERRRAIFATDALFP